MKLWSYGDSHPGGHELGSFDDLGRAWLTKNFNVSDRNQFMQKYGNHVYKNTLYPLWNREIGTPHRPELSYAGQLADIIGAEFVSRAIPGSGNDSSVVNFIQDLKQISSDDVVLFSVSSIHRFVSVVGRHSKLLEHTEMISSGPSDNSWKIWGNGMVQLILNLCKCKLVIVSSTQIDDFDIEGINFIKSLDNFFEIEFMSFANQYDYNVRYPLGHISEHVHKDYAKLIHGRFFT